MVGRRDFDPQVLGAKMYALLNSVVVPRPIAWVATRSAAGVNNLAPHSYFTVSSVVPPVVQFTSVGTKDSLTNVRQTGEFVVHVVTRELALAANLTATDFPHDLSEFGQAGLSTEPARTVSVPRLAQSPVAIECRAVGERSFGDSTVVFGEVLWMAIDPRVLAADDLADVAKLAPVARLGRNEWGAVGEVFDLRRVPYRELQQEPK